MSKHTAKRIEIEVAPAAAIASEFLAAWKGAARATEPATARITFESANQLHSAISDKRLELMRAVAQAPSISIKALAERLGRDYKNVHTAVGLLLDLGLLERTENGGLWARYDEIVIHAQIRSAA